MKTIRDLLERIGANRVIEAGTIGDWSYHKRNNGEAECWCAYSVGTFAPTGSFAGIYYRTLDKAFPSGLFVSAPEVVHVDAYWDTGLSWGASRVVTKDTVQFTLFKNSNSSYGATIRIDAKGKWK